jgi:hypothetical protein
MCVHCAVGILWKLLMNFLMMGAGARKGLMGDGALLFLVFRVLI